MTEREKKIFDMQQPSTKAALLRQSERDPKDDWAYISRPIPESYLAVPDAKTKDELVACRPITYQESKVYKKLRYNRGEYLAEMRKEGDASSVGEEKKKSAIEAFMDIFSPSAIKAKFAEIMKEIKKPMSYAEMVAEEMGKVKK